LTKISFRFDNSGPEISTGCGKGMWIIWKLKSLLHFSECAQMSKRIFARKLRGIKGFPYIEKAEQSIRGPNPISRFAGMPAIAGQAPPDLSILRF
jgi:hypothetical protein